VKTGQQFTYIQSVDIAFFRSSDGLTQAFLDAGKKYFVDHSLDDLEKMLQPRDFFRINRSMTIRLQAIKTVHPHLNGRLKIDTTPASPEDVYISRERAGEFKMWLGG